MLRGMLFREENLARKSKTQLGFGSDHVTGCGALLIFTYCLPLTCTKNLYKSQHPVEQAKIKKLTDLLCSASSDAAHGQL